MKKIEQLTEEMIDLRRQAQEKDRENYELKQGKLDDNKKTIQGNSENKKATKVTSTYLHSHNTQIIFRMLLSLKILFGELLKNFGMSLIILVGIITL